MTKIRTRFAPSPTGRMHVGNLRTALYAYLITKHEGGDFILRIEDTDQERYVEGAVDIIYRTLEKTGLIHDEGPDKDGGFGPYVQSERQATGMYLKYAKQLIEQGDAYYCFCGKEELESMKRTVAGRSPSMIRDVSTFPKKRFSVVWMRENLMLSVSICRQRELQPSTMLFMVISQSTMKRWRI